MFGIGIFELAVVFVVALIVLGPKRLPEAARTLGRWFYQARDAAHAAKEEIEKEWDTERDIKNKDDKANKNGRP